jgi:FixJ family two-component response regulator
MRVKAIEQGAVHYTIKPLGRRQLAEMIKRFLPELEEGAPT